MGMPIDKTISELEILKKNTFSYMTANQAFTTAIEVMKKYQKITEIVKSKTTWVSYDIGFRQIKKVVEDGNEDC